VGVDLPGETDAVVEARVELPGGGESADAETTTLVGELR